MASAEHQLVTEKFITACANGDIAALTAVLDPTVWGVGTVLADPAPPPQINHGPEAVATNLMRYLWPGVTLVSGPAGQPVVLAFAERRLFAAIVLTIRGRPRHQDRGDRRPVGACGSPPKSPGRWVQPWISDRRRPAGDRAHGRGAPRNTRRSSP